MYNENIAATFTYYNLTPKISLQPSQITIWLVQMSSQPSQITSIHRELWKTRPSLVCTVKTFSENKSGIFCFRSKSKVMFPEFSTAYEMLRNILLSVKYLRNIFLQCAPSSPHHYKLYWRLTLCIIKTIYYTVK